MRQLSGYNYHLNLKPEGKNVERSIVSSGAYDKYFT